MSVKIEELEGIVDESYRYFSELITKTKTPLDRTGPGYFKVNEAAEMVGRTPASINAAERKGVCPPCDRGEDKVLNGNVVPGNRLGYTLEQINILREHFGTRPRFRLKDAPAMVQSILTQKGGVGKSGTCNNLGHALALAGFRVLILDGDSQGTTTSNYGYMPELVETDSGDEEEHAEQIEYLESVGVTEDIREKYGVKDSTTLTPWLKGQRTSLHYAIRKTSWDGLDVLPTNLSLFETELELYREEGNLSYDIYTILDEGIKTIKDDYDVILIDGPPSLSVISINILNASDGLIVPIPPRMHDFMSTVSFQQTVIELMKQCDKEYSFLKWVVTLFQAQKVKKQKPLIEKYRELCGEKYMFNTVIKSLSDIENAFSEYLSPFEYGEVKSKETIPMLKAFAEEVAEEIYKFAERQAEEELSEGE